MSEEEVSLFTINGKQKSQLTKSKKKKDRKSDQNLCKKYHSYANKCLRILKIYKYLSPYIKKIYKRNYFIFALIVAQKAGKLNEFMQLYKEMA